MSLWSYEDLKLLVERIHVVLCCCVTSLQFSFFFIDINGKTKAPPPVDISTLLVRQLDQRHGNLDGVWMKWEDERSPASTPHLSGPRCLGQVLVLGQVKLLSEHGNIEDSHQEPQKNPTRNWEHIIQKWSSRWVSKITRRSIRKGYIEVLSSSSCGNKMKDMIGWEVRQK